MRCARLRSIRGCRPKGTGEYEWQGFLPASAHAQVVNPASGVILNWNNKPARGYAGADDEWTWGPVQRVDLLWRGIQRRQEHTLASVVGAMNGAATQDLRLVRLWPILKDVLARGSGTPRATAAAAQLDAWLATGGSRIDADAAVMDAAWSPMANAVLAPVLDNQARAALAKLVPDDPPLSTDGSSAYSGWWSYVQKHLRSLLGRPVTGPYRTRFCGGGDVARCAASLWDALDAAAAQLGATQGPDPAAWRADATAERIRCAPGILTRTMRGSNKPTFQQAITFRSHR